jgi:membrane protease YdiL (CAAX protease family)
VAESSQSFFLGTISLPIISESRCQSSFLSYSQSPCQSPFRLVAGWANGLGQGIVSYLVIATLTFSLAEEIGWRGYLLPKLVLAAGAVPAMALTGLMHGAFHLPLILLTSFYHPDGNRLIVIPLFLAAFTIGGLPYGYLRLTYDSTWPASLAHSAHNYFWALFGSLTIATSPVAAEYLAGESGILIIIGYGIAAAWLLRGFRGRNRARSSGAGWYRAGGTLKCEHYAADTSRRR